MEKVGKRSMVWHEEGMRRREEGGLSNAAEEKGLMRRGVREKRGMREEVEWREGVTKRVKKGGEGRCCRWKENE